MTREKRFEEYRRQIEQLQAENEEIRRENKLLKKREGQRKRLHQRSIKLSLRNSRKQFLSLQRENELLHDTAWRLILEVRKLRNTESFPES